MPAGPVDVGDSGGVLDASEGVGLGLVAGERGLVGEGVRLLELIFIVLEVLEDFLLIVNQHRHARLDLPRRLGILLDKVDLYQLPLIQVRGVETTRLHAHGTLELRLLEKRDRGGRLCVLGPSHALLGVRPEDLAPREMLGRLDPVPGHKGQGGLVFTLSDVHVVLSVPEP